MGATTSKSPKKSPMLRHFVSWFEIPALNLERAVRFYNKIYTIDMETMTNGEYKMAFFPANKGIGGALVNGPGSTPGETGILIYLNGGNDLDIVLGKVEEAGGRVVLNKTLINEQAGYFALFIDSEGNKMALHSKN